MFIQKSEYILIGKWIIINYNINFCGENNKEQTIQSEWKSKDGQIPVWELRKYAAFLGNPA